MVIIKRKINQGNNNSKLKPYEPEGGIKPGEEKSIYDI